VIRTLPFGNSVEVWLARAICIAAISATEPVPEGQGAPASEKQTKGTTINESNKKLAVFAEREFMARLTGWFN
jgi:hypothetical protein